MLFWAINHTVSNGPYQTLLLVWAFGDVDGHPCVKLFNKLEASPCNTPDYFNTTHSCGVSFIVEFPQ